METGFRKISLLFDATVIINDLDKDAGRSGIFFAAFNILKYLLASKEVNISLFCHKNRLPELRKVLDAKFGGEGLKIFTEKDLAAGAIEGFDIYFSPVYKIPPYIRKNRHIIKYTILYDVIMMMFPEYFPIKHRWFSEMVDGINGNDHYFSISKNTRDDFIRYVPRINPNNILVTPLAASDSFNCDKNHISKGEIFKKYDIPNDKKYIFSLCTLEPRKNLLMSIRCFIRFIDENKIDDLVFILGGSRLVNGFLQKLRDEIADFYRYSDRIILTGYIDDADLPAFYRFSEFFVYPSLYEGFGLPVLEAMKCGIPVITSNNSSIPEVVGDAGIMIDPGSEQELISALERLYFNVDLRAELSKKGLERAKSFSWERTVDIMIRDMIENMKSRAFKTDYEVSDGEYPNNDIGGQNPDGIITKVKEAILNSRLRKPLRKAYRVIKYKKL